MGWDETGCMGKGCDGMWRGAMRCQGMASTGEEGNGNWTHWNRPGWDRTRWSGREQKPIEWIAYECPQCPRLNSLFHARAQLTPFVRHCAQLCAIEPQFRGFRGQLRTGMEKGFQLRTGMEKGVQLRTSPCARPAVWALPRGPWIFSRGPTPQKGGGN